MFEYNSCRLSSGGGDRVTIPAGEVSSELAVCGFEPQRLFGAYPAGGRYTAGLCPGVSLEKGTMFPELISEYKGGGTCLNANC